MPATGTKLEQLLRALADGSEEAAWEIVETYSPNILRAVRRSMPVSIRPKLDSVDIVQSVWASLLVDNEEMRAFRTPEKFVAYLVGTARQKVLETYRHYTRNARRNLYRERPLNTARPEDDTATDEPEREPALLVGPDPTASAVASVRETWEGILKQCDEREQRVVQLRLSGRTNAEIAEELNMHVRTVRRILQRLTEMLAK
jgi:RNA polymerase sigma factor (sigma-70 family)